MFLNYLLNVYFLLLHSVVNFGELLYAGFEVLDCSVYNGGVCHIYSSNEKAFKGRFRAAALEEIYILIYVCRTLGFNSLYDSGSRGNTGCVLIYVEAGVEVRYSHPLVRYLLVTRNVGTEVLFNKLVVLLVEKLCRKRLALLGKRVDITLKLRKHSLTVKRSLVGIHKLVENVKLFFVTLALAELSVRKEKLVDSRCNLCYKYGVLSVVWLIVLIREIGMH